MERFQPRDRDRDEPTEARKALPQRQEIAGRDRAYRLATDELRTLETIGKFRTVRVADLRDADLKRLRAQGLIERKSLHLKDHRLDVAVLTERGLNLLRDQQNPTELQQFHAGFVKPNEVNHDAGIYRMYRKAAREIRARGGMVERVVLDYELKAAINSAINKGANQQSVADQYELKVVNGTIPLPDLRIHYIDAEGQQHHEDLELVTRHYHRAHLAGKAQAGFRMYAAPSGPRAKPLDDHHVEWL
jgi:hypothetical protein